MVVGERDSGPTGRVSLEEIGAIFLSQLATSSRPVAGAQPGAREHKKLAISSDSPRVPGRVPDAAAAAAAGGEEEKEEEEV